MSVQIDLQRQFVSFRHRELSLTFKFREILDCSGEDVGQELNI